MNRDERLKKRDAMRRLLWSWGNTADRIRRLETERAAFRLMADDARNTLKAQTLSGMPNGGQSSDLSDTVERVIDMAQRYDEQSAKIDAEITEAIRLRNCISDCMRMLEPAHEKVLAYRYMDGHGWQYIALKMNYDISSVHRIEAQAVDIIAGMVEIG